MKKIIILLVSVILISGGVLGYKIITNTSSSVNNSTNTNTSNTTNTNTTTNNNIASTADTINKAAAEAIINALPQMQAQEVKMFNSQFTVYEGSQKSSNIKALMDKISASNTINGAHIVKVSGVGNTPEGIKNIVNAQKQYEVKVLYGNDGCVKEVNVMTL